MNDAQKRAIKAALPFCRDRINVPAKGSMDYEDVAQQISALPDATAIKSAVAWVLDYERADSASSENHKSKSVR